MMYFSVCTIGTTLTYQMLLSVFIFDCVHVDMCIFIYIYVYSRYVCLENYMYCTHLIFVTTITIAGCVKNDKYEVCRHLLSFAYEWNIFPLLDFQHHFHENKRCQMCPNTKGAWLSKRTIIVNFALHHMVEMNNSPLSNHFWNTCGSLQNKTLTALEVIRYGCKPIRIWTVSVLTVCWYIKPTKQMTTFENVSFWSNWSLRAISLQACNP